ncbi:hypothetical protein SmJEL517_g05228 [Synchytrium microbalum]|uniref:Protein kinase domain-containing protein n=1 Tax=Synchytrium microbalum TaxID=1806994 RepID=A0A507BMD3_9FUNG|nr:uncharacterized protein SmJEL517_g05228 [Synchytrium microbalum]TPX31410.1 hypothetical protein SmJEL517_g05228 [Synchytrium microbalum]
MNGVKPWGRLVYLTNGPAKSIDLINAEYAFGRGKACQIVLDDNQMISKRQFVIALVEDTPCLMDVSQNGTLVNGHNIARHRIILTHAAEIEIAPEAYFFVFYLPNQPIPLTLPPNSHYMILNTKTLGRGSFADVKMAIDLRSGERVAVKIFDQTITKGVNTKSAMSMLDVRNEVDLLKRIRHPNVVAIKDVIHTTSHVYLFMERITGGELFDHIVSGTGVLEEAEAKFVFFQIARAVHYLHQQGITHRDLKPENLLLETKQPFSRMILTDFGLAKFRPPLQRMQTTCGTFSYMSPEMLTENSPGVPNTGYSSKVDCWSLGCLLFAMLYGELPFGQDTNGHGTDQLFSRIRKGNFEFPNTRVHRVTSQAKNLIECLLKVDPQERYSMEQALEHPWITCQGDILKQLYHRMLKKSGWS